jgi:hypothetical protein
LYLLTSTVLPDPLRVLKGLLLRIIAIIIQSILTRRCLKGVLKSGPLNLNLYV